MDTVHAEPTRDVETTPPEAATGPTQAQQIARLRVSLALGILGSISENLRETARTFADLSIDELADAAERAVRVFGEAEHLIGELMNNAASSARRAA